MRKIIDIKTIERYSSFDKPITDEATLGWGGSFPSRIADQLIFLTARYTERFASDLLIDIDSLKKEMVELQKMQDETPHFRVFGFRESGVDNNAYVECRSPYEYRTEYRAVWRLDYHYSISFNRFLFELYRIRDYVNDDNYVEVKG